LIPPLMRIASRAGMLDMPEGRKIHGTPVPKVGGVAIVIGTLLPVVLWLNLARELKGWLIGLSAIIMAGLLDDLYGLGYKEKFLAQTVAALSGVFFAKLYPLNLGLLGGQELVLPIWLSIPLTLIFMIGVTNALNLADGLDGLAGGIALLIFGATAFLAYQSQEMAIVVVSLAIMGAIFGFLRYNTHPAIIFMGDTGSQFLGFSAALLLLILTQRETNPLSPVLPLIIIGVPVLDTMMVMLERVLQGRHPFLPDRSHLHYKLLDAGFSHTTSVVILYLVQGLYISLGMVFCYYPDTTLLLLYLFSSLVIMALAYLSSRLHSLWRKRVSNLASIYFPSWAPYRDRVREWIFRLIIALLLIIILIFPLFSPQIPPDMGIISFILLSFTLIIAFFPNKGWLRSFTRLDLYLIGTFLVYLSHENKLRIGPPIIFNLHSIQLVTFLSLGVLVAVYIKMSSPQDFRITSLDYLIIIMALIIPYVPSHYLPIHQVGLFVIKLIVLFLSMEVVLNRAIYLIEPLSISTLAILFITGIRGFI